MTEPPILDHPKSRKPDHRTDKAILLLKNIANRIQQLEETILTPPLQYTQQWLRAEIKEISQALDHVTRRNEIVDTERKRLRTRLRTINEQYCHEDQAMSTQQPVEFNAGKDSILSILVTKLIIYYRSSLSDII
jgi:regulator of replication initiation timing